MSSNVGLSTPRGSGTSGYVQRNLSLLKPRDAGYGAPYPPSGGRDALPALRTRKPDKDILEHDRRREIEIKVLELRDQLEDAGELGEDEMDEKCEALRERLGRELEKGLKSGSVNARGLKIHQVHELAEVKMRESERLRRALGLKGDEVGESSAGGPDGAEGKAGDEHPMARQERRKRERELEREAERERELLREKEKEKEMQRDERRMKKNSERERDTDGETLRRYRHTERDRERDRSGERDHPDRYEKRDRW